MSQTKTKTVETTKKQELEKEMFIEKNNNGNHNEHLIYSKSVIQRIGNYLMTRPYGEVYELISELSQGIEKK